MDFEESYYMYYNPLSSTLFQSLCASLWPINKFARRTSIYSEKSTLSTGSLIMLPLLYYSRYYIKTIYYVHFFVPHLGIIFPSEISFLSKTVHQSFFVSIWIHSRCTERTFFKFLCGFLTKDVKSETNESVYAKTVLCCIR